MRAATSAMAAAAMLRTVQARPQAQSLRGPPAGDRLGPRPPERRPRIRRGIDALASRALGALDRFRHYSLIDTNPSQHCFNLGLASTSRGHLAGPCAGSNGRQPQRKG